MDPMTLAVAGVAAAGDLPDRHRHRDVRRRLGRQRPPRALRLGAPERQAGRPAGQGGIADLLAQSVALAQLNKVVEQRDFGANLARDIARADLKLKPSRVPRHLGAARSSASRSLMIVFSLGLPALRSPIVLLVGALRRLLAAAVLAGPPQGRPARARSTSSCPTRSPCSPTRLRAGSSFLQAIELVVRESRPPISTEFGRVIREVNLGLPFEQALENMVRRVRSDDLELMATAISIQHTVGGNLAEILDSIAYTIRERVRIKGEIRTLTAQQRLSGYVVGFLPIGLAGFLFVAAPNFMDADVPRSRPRSSACRPASSSCSSADS